MINKIVSILNNKNILILGFGKEGRSTYEFIIKYIENKTITILSDSEISIDYENTCVTVKTDDITRENLLGYDYVIKSPGISFKNIDVTDINIISQLELALMTNKENIIAITGTKGKSTTSSLIYKVLKDQGVDALLLGNIGVPVLDKVSSVGVNTLLVIECSSHQLEYVKTSPNIALILNLYQEHLDHYNKLEDYYKAKINITKYQSNNDYILCNNSNLKYIEDISLNDNVNKIIINKDIYIDNDYVYINNNKVYFVKDNRLLLGDHNLINIMFVLGVANILNLDNSKVINSINNFKGLEHRMEYVGLYEDIKFYNDSISTIPEAVENCCNTLKDVDTLIIGGLDRGISYSKLVEFINNSNITNIICMPSTGHTLSNLLNKKVYLVNTMQEVVDTALSVTKKGCSAVLSPAAPSYGFYKNFEDRGNEFKRILNNKESLI